jgi:uncharacterized protein (TIGR02231 family)
MDLNYFAFVSQNTGLDWKGIPLTLSTSNPSENNTKPELSPWYLSFIQYQQYKDNVISNSAIPLRQESLTLKKPAAPSDESKWEDFVTVTENLIRTEYEIKLKYDIASDNNQHKVLINRKEIPINLLFAAVPKLSHDAFLMAAVSGWEDMNIVPGQARLYFDGAYVGEMFLAAGGTDDTLHLNLGRDKQITMTRKKIKEKHTMKLVGDQKVETRTIEIVVKNTNNIDIEMLLEDQVAVAQGTDEIKVKLLDGNGASLEQYSGKLTWKLKLKARESKKITFTYEIRYPQDKVVYGL